MQLIATSFNTRIFDSLTYMYSIHCMYLTARLGCLFVLLYVCWCCDKLYQRIEYDDSGQMLFVGALRSVIYIVFFVDENEQLAQQIMEKDSKM